MAEVARNRRLRHWAIVGAVPRRSSMVETKYDAVSTSIGYSISAVSSSRSTLGTFGGSAGILNVVFGVLLLIWPATGILTLVWLVGIFTLAGGIALVILAFRVRSVARSTDRALGAR